MALSSVLPLPPLSTVPLLKDNRPMTTVVHFPLATAVLVASLSACVSIPPLDSTGVNSQVSPAIAAADFETQQGLTVQWGGRIVRTQNQETATLIEVLAYPLRRSGNPNERREPSGRFLLEYSGYLEPVEFAPGRYVTAVGELTRIDIAQVGEADYRLPVMLAGQIHLWPKRRDYGVVPHFGIGLSFGF